MLHVLDREGLTLADVKNACGLEPDVVKKLLGVLSYEGKVEVDRDGRSKKYKLAMKRS